MLITVLDKVCVIVPAHAAAYHALRIRIVISIATAIGVIVPRVMVIDRKMLTEEMDTVLPV